MNVDFSLKIGGIFWAPIGHHAYTVEPRFKEPLFNEVLNITNNILRPGQSYSKMYGPGYNEHNLETQT